MPFPRLLIPPLIILSAAFAPAAVARDILTVTAVGDVMMGTTGLYSWLPPEDGRGIFDGVKALLREGDIVFGNLEGPLIDNGVGAKCGKKIREGSLCFEFSMPERYVSHLAEAGFGALSLANNHAFDYGPEGVLRTLEVLSAAGIRPVGGIETALFTVKGKRVAVTGFSYSPPSPYSHSILDIAGAKGLVERLKGENDLVIVSFHGGAEGREALHVADVMETFAGENRGNVVAFARAAVDAGADLVLGHGPHVPRAVEVYKGKLIAYSLGNFLTYGPFSLKEASALSCVLTVRLDLDTGDFAGGRIHSVELVNRGIPVPDPEHRAAKLIRELSEQDFGERTVAIGNAGRLRAVPRNAGRPAPGAPSGGTSPRPGLPPREGVAGGAQEGRPGVANDLDRDRGQQVPEAPLGQE